MYLHISFALFIYLMLNVFNHWLHKCYVTNRMSTWYTRLACSDAHYVRASWAHVNSTFGESWAPPLSFCTGCEIVIGTVPITGHEVYKRKTKLGVRRVFVRVLTSLYNEAEVAVTPLQLDWSHLFCAVWLWLIFSRSCWSWLGWWKHWPWRVESNSWQAVSYQLISQLRAAAVR